MLGVTTVVLILCFFNSIGLVNNWNQIPSCCWALFPPYFSFIPYFGNFIGGSIPFIFALLTEDSQVYALRIAVFVYIVHFFENNILSPNIVGNNIRLNPFVIILGLIAGAMIWGIPGMLVINSLSGHGEYNSERNSRYAALCLPVGHQGNPQACAYHGKFEKIFYYDKGQMDKKIARTW